VRRQRGTRIALVLMTATLFIVFTAGMALAHYAYNRAYTWYSGDSQYCLRHHSEVELKDNDAHWFEIAWISFQERTEGIPGGNCDQPAASYPNVGPGKLRVQPQLWVWGGSSWGICHNHKIFYNTQSDHGLRHEHQYDANVDAQTCGYSWYGNLSLGQVNLNGKWRPSTGSKWLWSGCHYYGDHNQYNC
jgi:hypothetical protein